MELTPATRPLWQRLFELADLLEKPAFSSAIGTEEFPVLEVRAPEMSQSWYFKFLQDEVEGQPHSVYHFMPGRKALIEWYRAFDSATEADVSIAFSLAHLLQLSRGESVVEVPPFDAILEELSGELPESWQPGKAALYHQKEGYIQLPVEIGHLKAMIRTMEAAAWLAMQMMLDRKMYRRVQKLSEDKVLQLTFDAGADTFRLGVEDFPIEEKDMYYISGAYTFTAEQRRRLSELPLASEEHIAVAVRPSPALMTEEGRLQIHFLVTALWEGDLRPQTALLFRPEELGGPQFIDRMIDLFEEHEAIPGNIISDTRLGAEMSFPLTVWGSGIFLSSEEAQPLFQQLEDFLYQIFEIDGDVPESEFSDN